MGGIMTTKIEWEAWLLKYSQTKKFHIFFIALTIAISVLALFRENGTYSPSATTSQVKVEVETIKQRPSHKMPPANWHYHPHVHNGEKRLPLTNEQVSQYYKDGFLVLPKFFESRLSGLRSDIEKLIDDLAKKLYALGKVKSLYEEFGWTERLLRLTEDFEDAPVLLIKGGILPKNFQQLFADESMLDIATQLGVAGEEGDIAVNAAWNIRAKMPSHNATVVPWHQDNSYWEPRIWDEHVLTVWVALVDSSTENGCMQYIKGGHLSGKTARHVIGKSTTTWYTELDMNTVATDLFDYDSCSSDSKVSSKCKADIESRIFTAEVSAGTAIIFPGTLPHRSLPSTSNQIRWSTDYRLHRAKTKRSGFSKNDKSLDWFYGLKDSLMLQPKKPTAEEWEEWAAVDRTEVQDASMGNESKEILPDAVIIGPWMDLWNITTHQEDAAEPIVVQDKGRMDCEQREIRSSKLQRKNLDDIRVEFSKYDKNGNGFLSRSDFYSTLQDFTIFSREETEALFDRFGDDESGMIDYLEFMDTIHHVPEFTDIKITRDKVNKVQELIQRAIENNGYSLSNYLKSWDVDSSGILDRVEFFNGIRNTISKNELSDLDIAFIFQLCMDDDEGGVDLEEFQIFLEKVDLSKRRLSQLSTVSEMRQELLSSDDTDEIPNENESTHFHLPVPPPPPHPSRKEKVRRRSLGIPPPPPLSLERSKVEKRGERETNKSQKTNNILENTSLDDETKKGQISKGKKYDGLLRPKYMTKEEREKKRFGSAFTRQMNFTCKRPSRVLGELQEKKVDKLRFKLRAATFQSGNLTTCEAIRSLFERYDSDNSRGLQYPEFVNAVRKLVRFTDDEIELLLVRLDLDGDGEISLHEFVSFLDPNNERFLDSTSKRMRQVERQNRYINFRERNVHQKAKTEKIKSPERLKILEAIGIKEPIEYAKSRKQGAKDRTSFMKFSRGKSLYEKKKWQNPLSKRKGEAVTGSSTDGNRDVEEGWQKVLKYRGEWRDINKVLSRVHKRFLHFVREAHAWDNCLGLQYLDNLLEFLLSEYKPVGRDVTDEQKKYLHKRLRSVVDYSKKKRLRFEEFRDWMRLEAKLIRKHHDQVVRRQFKIKQEGEEFAKQVSVLVGGTIGEKVSKAIFSETHKKMKRKEGDGGALQKWDASQAIKAWVNLRDSEWKKCNKASEEKKKKQVHSIARKRKAISKAMLMEEATRNNRVSGDFAKTLN
eukprot:g2569.t1